MKKTTKSFIQGVVHCAFWLIGILAVSKIMEHSEARIAYGYLSGWWAALYFGYIAKLNIASSVSAFLIYCCIGILAFFFDWSWFYKGLPETVTLQYVVVLVVGAGVFVSPILINAGMRLLAGKLKK